MDVYVLFYEPHISRYITFSNVSGQQINIQVDEGLYDMKK